MSFPKPSHWWGWAAIALWFIFHAVTLTHLPSVYGDEPNEIQFAATLAASGEPGYRTARNVYSADFAELADNSPNAIRPFYTRPLAFFLKWGSVDLLTARLLSLISGVGLLIIFFWTALRWTQVAAALAGLAVLLFEPTVALTSHTARPDILLALAGFAGFSLSMYAIESQRAGWAWAGGLLTGLAVGVHSNGVIFLPSLFVGLWAARKVGMLKIYLLPQVIATVIGLGAWVLFSWWDKFIPGWVVWRGYWGYGLPVLSGDGLKTFWSELRRFIFPEPIYLTSLSPFFSWGMRFEFLLFLASAIFVGRRFSKNFFAASLLGFSTVMMLMMASLVAQKNPAYLAVYIPFGGLAVALASDQLKSLSKAVGIAILLVAVVHGALYTCQQYRKPTDYQFTIDKLKSAIPAGSRVLGPGNFWLGMEQYEWKDSNILVFEKWLRGSSDHVESALKRLQPDYLVLDTQFANLLENAYRRKNEPIGTYFIPLDAFQNNFGETFVIVRPA